MDIDFRVCLTAGLVLAGCVTAGFWARSRLSQRPGAQAPMDRRRGFGQFFRPYRVPLGVAAFGGEDRDPRMAFELVEAFVWFKELADDGLSVQVGRQQFKDVRPGGARDQRIRIRDSWSR